MLHKASQFLTLLVSAVTLVILLLFLSRQSDSTEMVTKKEAETLIANSEKGLKKHMGEFENLNGIDALNEQYQTLVAENEALRADIDALQADLARAKTSNSTTNKKKTTEKSNETAKQPEVLANEQVKVATDDLNFRHEASLSAPIQTMLPYGTKLEVLDKKVIEKDGHKWVKVGLENGDAGYVAREFVQ